MNIENYVSDTGNPPIDDEAHDLGEVGAMEVANIEWCDRNKAIAKLAELEAALPNQCDKGWPLAYAIFESAIDNFIALHLAYRRRTLLAANVGSDWKDVDEM